MTKQDSLLATFCSKITKEQGFVIPANFDNIQLFAIFRAFSTFPKISFFSQYFEQIVRIDSAILVETLGKTVDNVLFEDANWIQTSDGVFLKCKVGFLQISQITLKTGKSINFRGFRF